MQPRAYIQDHARIIRLEHVSSINSNERHELDTLQSHSKLYLHTSLTNLRIVIANFFLLRSLVFLSFYVCFTFGKQTILITAADCFYHV